MPWDTKPLKVWNGSTWVTETPKAWSGSAWVDKPSSVKVWSSGAAPSYAFQSNLSGANGANVVAGTNNNFTGQFFGGTGGTITYDTTMSVPTGPNNAMKIITTAATTNGVTIRVDDTINSWPVHYQGFWFRSTAAPTTNQYIFHSSPAGAGAQIQNLQLLTTNRLRLRDNFGGGTGTGHDLASAITLSVNTWYWIECFFSMSQMQMKLWSAAGSLLETSALGPFSTTPTPQRLQWGAHITQAYTCWFADIRVSTTGWVGFPT